MFRSRTISVSIHRPWREVYEFLAEPLNLPTWGSTLGSTIEHQSGNDWVSTNDAGRVVFRYHPRNDYGILDFSVFAEGQPPRFVPMRIVANGEDGAEVIYTQLQQPGMADEVFESEVEWVESDLLALKSLLEVGFVR